ncbi:MAG: hypothetical protein IH596_13080 [Bacteroidales bacterium]|nr:hypothetical protein [Bacteroidales bacterium]
MMEEKNIQEQIDELSHKLDRVLEFVETQHRKQEELDDLIKDVSLISKDAFNSTVSALDKAGIELDPCGIQCLLIKLVRNLSTFGEMVELMESAKDLAQDLSPIIRQVGLDVINKMHELDEKGYLESFTTIGKNLTNKDTVDAFVKMSQAIADVRMDDKLDDKSFWQLFKQMRSKEVRKSLSYSLRLLEEINKK